MILSLIMVAAFFGICVGFFAWKVLTRDEQTVTTTTTTKVVTHETVEVAHPHDTWENEGGPVVATEEIAEQEVPADDLDVDNDAVIEEPEDGDMVTATSWSEDDGDWLQEVWEKDGKSYTKTTGPDGVITKTRVWVDPETGDELETTSTFEPE